ncbi:PQQ-binding-like beta-propeller repeat protein [Halorubellus litoreus]|uniref:PQQ-binding-like beta-propeller repeat protein n=1 Tax=Halorubellus litoreus TaxID=755308 RepID=A0ABD5VHF9_9EURY
MLRRERFGVLRGDVDAAAARADAVEAVTASSPAVREAGLELVLALEDPAPMSLLADYSLPSDALAADDVDGREGQLFATLAREDPPGVRKHVGEVVAAASHREDAAARDVACALAGRDPAVLKPAVESLVAAGGGSDRSLWTLARLGVAEPPVLRRHLANAAWTVERADADPVPDAVESMTGAVVALDGEVPESVAYERLLEHVDDATRVAAANGLSRIAGADGQAAELEWLDAPAAVSALVDGTTGSSREERQAAVRALSAVAAKRPAAAPTAVRELVARLTDDPAVIRSALSAIWTVVGWRPDERAPGTVRRVAARLGDDDAGSALTEALLSTLSAHGAVTVDALDLDVVAVFLGHDAEEVRRVAAGTLLDLGASAPGSRPAVVRYLRWARHDGTAGVRRKALSLLGTAGALWQGEAPTVVDALVAHLSQYPDDATQVADALLAVADATPPALPAVVDRLRRRVDRGELQEAAASEFLCELATSAPDALAASGEDPLDAAVGDLVATGPDDESGREAARAVLAVARTSPASVAPYADRLRAGFEADDAGLAVRARLAAAYGVVADGSDAAEATAWLGKRVLSAPVLVGRALAHLAGDHPETALPALESVLATVERECTRDGAPAVDVGAFVDRVVVPLVGSHPAAGPPVVRALAAALEAPAARDPAASALCDALAEWPYLAPLAVDALVDRLDDADGDVLREVVAPLSWTDDERAAGALRELAAHPDAEVRRAATARSNDPSPPPDAPDSDWLADFSPSEATPADVDRLARGLATAAPVDSAAVLGTLQRVARERPSLRARATCHVLGAVVADASPGSLTETLAAFAPTHAPDDATHPTENPGRVGALLALAADAEPAVVRGQATAALAATVRRDRALATATLSEHLHDAIGADSPLVTGRALRAVRVLAADLPLETFVDAGALEARLFGPAAVVPRATWTVAAVAAQRPDAAEALAESLSGLLDWTTVHRAHALRTIPDVLAAAPGVDAALAPAVLEQVPADGVPEDRVIQAVGHLSGEAIASTAGGPAALLGALDAVYDGRAYALLTDRLLRVAESAPEAVVAALEAREAEALPPMRREGLAHYLRALERAVAHGGDRVAYPFIDVGNVFDPHEDAGRARMGADLAERDVTHFDLGDAPELRRRAKRSFVAVLAETGHVEFLRVLGAYEDGKPEVEPTPDQVATWFALTTDPAASTAASTLCESADADFVAAVGTRLADALPSLPLDAARRMLAALPAFATAVPAGDARETIREALADALDGDWAVALAAVDAVTDLGTTDGIAATTALEMLFEHLDAAEPTLRRRVAEAIATLSREPGADVASVRDRLVDPPGAEPASVDRQRARVLALGALAAGEPGLRDGIVAELTDALTDGDARVRECALGELARVADGDATAVVESVDEIAVRVADVEARVARAAVDCLRTVGDDRTHAAVVAGALVRALDTVDGQRGATCAEALVDVLDLHVALPERDVDRLREHVDDPHPGVRRHVLRALSHVGTRADRPAIEAAVTDPRPAVRAAARTARDRLDAALDAPSTAGTNPSRVPTGRANHARTAATAGDPPRDAPAETWAVAPDWDVDLSEPAHAALAVVDDAVYVDGRTWVWALDAATGTPKWRYERAPIDDGGHDGEGLGDLFGDGGVRTSLEAPTVAHGTVYVGHAGSNGPGVYAIDAQSGREQWTGLVDRRVESTPAVVDDAVLVGDDDGTLSALAAADGDPRWRFETAGGACSTPATDGETAYVLAEGTHLHAVDATDGTERWRVDLDGGGGSAGGRAPPAVRGNTVYVCPGGSAVLALDATDGTERWRADVADATAATAAVGPRRVFVGLDDGDVRALDAADGSVQWTRTVGDHGRVFPAVVGDHVVAGNATGTVHCLRPSDGTEEWRTSVGDPLESMPVVADGTVYAVDTTARTVAFD